METTVISNSLKLSDRIRASKFKVAVCGLGYIGVPLASVWLRIGAYVTGVDKSSTAIKNASIDKTHIPEPNVSEAFTVALREERFTVTDDLIEASRQSLFKMIYVHGPAADGSADLKMVKEVAKAIGAGLKKRDTVARNPGVPPSTTEDIVIPILEKLADSKLTETFTCYTTQSAYTKDKL